MHTPINKCQREEAGMRLFLLCGCVFFVYKFLQNLCVFALRKEKEEEDMKAKGLNKEK